MHTATYRPGVRRTGSSLHLSIIIKLLYSIYNPVLVKKSVTHLFVPSIPCDLSHPTGLSHPVCSHPLLRPLRSGCQPRLLQHKSRPPIALIGSAQTSTAHSLVEHKLVNEWVTLVTAVTHGVRHVLFVCCDGCNQPVMSFQKEKWKQRFTL